MAKLSTKNRKKVAKAEVTTGFQPLDPGKYIVKLLKCEAKISRNGNAMWALEFDSIKTLDGESKPGRIFSNMMLPIDEMPEDYANGEEKWEQYQGLTAGRLKNFFEAFGVSEDTDTDDLLGERVGLRLTVRTIQQGDRKGQKSNDVAEFISMEEIGDVDLDDDDEDGDKF